MTILVVNPNKKYPYEKNIDGSLQSMQEIVGGLIEAIYPFKDNVALVCNEEGKIKDLLPNRTVVYDDYDMDTIVGTFFLTGLTEESFGSLSDQQIAFYKKVFSVPLIDVVATNREIENGGIYGENTD